MVQQLHANWTAHEGQTPVGRAIFAEKVLSVFLQCGRKWGKTELFLYLLWRIAQTYPNSPCYYVAPLLTQAKEVVWADPRVKNFGPRDWLLPGSRGVNDTEMRLRFRNGSFIKVDGSDNYEKHRGTRFKICVYEEYKDHRPEFRLAMRPNASVLDGLEVFGGTPPAESDTDYEKIAVDHQEDPKKRFFQAPTWQNPAISKEWLKSERTGLYRRGEGDVWEREYGARMVKGGASKIFPMLSEAMVKPHSEVMRTIARDKSKLHFFAWFDPAGATCFAVLFLAINPYTKQIYFLDEIYEKRQADMTTRKIGQRAIEMRDEINAKPDVWRFGYDEAAAWFANEWLDNFPDEPGLEPSEKSKHDKLDGLSLIKDALLAGLCIFSDRCKWTFWELDRYAKDKLGKIPKGNDHLIDNLRYVFGVEVYSVPKATEPDPVPKSDMPRGRSIEQDRRELSEGVKMSDDWEDWNG